MPYYRPTLHKAKKNVLTTNKTYKNVEFVKAHHHRHLFIIHIMELFKHLLERTILCFVFMLLCVPVFLLLVYQSEELEQLLPPNSIADDCSENQTPKNMPEKFSSDKHI